MTTVQIPDFVDYPEFFVVNKNDHLFNELFCYIVEPYPFDGVNLYVGFREDCVIMRIADFKSNEIDHEQFSDFDKGVLELSNSVIDVMRHSRIIEASYYFANCNGKPVLVDMMVSANKFVGPGMLRDLFGKTLDTQKVIDIKKLNNEEIDSNKGNLVKPSRFRCLMDGRMPRPQYGVIGQ